MKPQSSPIRSPISSAMRSAFDSSQVQSFVLDSLATQPAAAYSLQKIRKDYTGSAIRVRRDSDNAELNIGFNAVNRLDTVALLAFVGAGSGFLVTWYDQTVNARNITQATAANQPRIVNAGVLDTQNNQPAVVFLGNQWLVGGNYATADLQLSAVIQRTPGYYVTTAVFGSTSTWLGFTMRWWGNLGAYLGTQNGAGDVYTISDVRDGLPRVTRWRTNAGVIEMARNGVVLATNSTAIGTSQIGAAQFGRWNGNEPYLGAMQEMILFATTLPNAADTQSVERSQGARHGIIVA